MFAVFAGHFLLLIFEMLLLLPRGLRRRQPCLTSRGNANLCRSAAAVFTTTIARGVPVTTAAGVPITGGASATSAAGSTAVSTAAAAAVAACGIQRVGERRQVFLSPAGAAVFRGKLVGVGDLLESLGPVLALRDDGNLEQRRVVSAAATQAAAEDAIFDSWCFSFAYSMEADLLLTYKTNGYMIFSTEVGLIRYTAARL